MNTHTFRAAAALLASAMLASSAVRAETVEYSFTATVSNEMLLSLSGWFTPTASSALPGDSIGLNSVISGHLYYDPAASLDAASQMAAEATGSNHAYTNASAGMDFTVAGSSLSYSSTAGAQTGMLVWNNAGSMAGADALTVGTAAPDNKINGIKASAAMFLIDNSGKAFQDTQTPTQLNDQQFDSRYMTATWVAPDGQQLMIRADLTALTAVPEPGSATMLLAGLAGLGLLARRRRA